MSSSTLVIGIGNDYRSDDGAGLKAIRALKAHKPVGVGCIEHTGGGVALLACWEQASSVILIDAVVSGARPGTIHRLDALAQPLPAGFAFPSTHAFGVAEAIHLARALDQLPASLILYGIEARSSVAGTQLSSEVEQAVQEVVRLVLHEVSNA